MMVMTVMLMMVMLVAMGVHADEPQRFVPSYGPPGQYELLPYDPVANADAVVISGKARFTVLTAHIIRMEYDTQGRFEDRATLAFLNRKLAVPAFKVASNATTLVVRTSAVELVYTVGQVFSPTSLRATSVDGTSAFKSWTYGQVDSGNLFGTIRTLDGLRVVPLNCTVLDEDHGNHHCADGLVSRDGWVVVNDTANQVLDDSSWWVGENADDTADMYLFAHGHAYTQALYEYSLLGGKMAMVPRYATGIWWSRWYNINNQDTRAIIDDYASRSLPLSLFVYDMDWHTKQGWGGYSFDRRLFPYPTATLAWLRRQGLGVTVNLHDDDGVRPNEVMHDALALYMGLDPATCGTIPFTVCTNRTYALGLEDIVWKNVLNQGVDFAWIDWQQGMVEGGCTGGPMNPTMWLSKLRATDHLRRSEPTRGMLLARFGGLGNHRYQVGFSGDVAGLTWTNMAFQPYFSLTASNVLFGHWSHDIVGPADDHELHARWIQWGAYSGVFRTHDRGMSAGACADTDPSSCGIVAVWKLPTRYFEVTRAVMRARSELMPYIYTMYRVAFDTGISVLRPMYYEWPALDDAYTAADPAGNMSQYMFGDDLLVAPVVAAADSTNMTTKTVWLPPGAWFDTLRGTQMEVTKPEGEAYTNAFDLSEVPVFVRSGAMVARWPLVAGQMIGRGRRVYDTLEFTVYPGASSNKAVVYEDDSETTAYLQAAFNLTTATYTTSADNTQVTFTAVTTNATGGPLTPGKVRRMTVVKLANVLPATAVTINQKPVEYAHDDSNDNAPPNTWTYCGRSLTLTVRTPVLDAGVPLTVVVNGQPLLHVATNGAKGINAHAMLAKGNLDEIRATPGAQSVQGGALDELASIGEHLTYMASVYDVHAFLNVLQTLPMMLDNAVTEVGALTPKNVPPNRRAYSLALLQSLPPPL